MKKYRVLRSARTDMQEIWNYIAEDNERAATALLAKFRHTFEVLEKDTGVGHTRRDLTSKPVLFCPVGAYVIIYTANANPIEILLCCMEPETCEAS